MRTIDVHVTKFEKTYMASLKDQDDHLSGDPIVVHGFSTAKEAIRSVLEKANIITISNTNESWQFPGITYGHALTGWMCGEIAEIRFWEEIYLAE